MANSTLSHEAVKSICDKLECSPSQHSKPNKLNSHGVNRSGASSASGSTSGFEKAQKGVPGYGGKFARGARQE